MVEKKSYKIAVCGKTYSIVSDESESHIAAVSHMLNGLMKDIATKLPQASLEQLSVLAALQFASQSIHLQETVDSQQLLCRSMTEMLDLQEL